MAGPGGGGGEALPPGNPAQPYRMLFSGDEDGDELPEELDHYYRTKTGPLSLPPPSPQALACCWLVGWLVGWLANSGGRACVCVC